MKTRLFTCKFSTFPAYRTIEHKRLKYPPLGVVPFVHWLAGLDFRENSSLSLPTPLPSFRSCSKDRADYAKGSTELWFHVYSCILSKIVVSKCSDIKEEWSWANMFQISCAVATDFPASVLWVWIGPGPVHLKFNGSEMWGIIRRKGLKGSEKQILGCHSYLGSLSDWARWPWSGRATPTPGSSSRRPGPGNHF